MWDDMGRKGETGSEGGKIVLDEEYDRSCRITLEKCKDYYAITCGVYGAMVHTAFSDEDSALQLYETMKAELQAFMDRDTTGVEENEFYRAFTSKY